MECTYLRIWFFSERECRYVCFPLLHSTIIERSEFAHQIIHVRHHSHEKHFYLLVLLLVGSSQPLILLLSWQIQQLFIYPQGKSVQTDSKKGQGNYHGYEHKRLTS